MLSPGLLSLLTLGSRSSSCLEATPRSYQGRTGEFNKRVCQAWNRTIFCKPAIGVNYEGRFAYPSSCVVMNTDRELRSSTHGELSLPVQRKKELDKAQKPFEDTR